MAFAYKKVSKAAFERSQKAHKALMQRADAQGHRVSARYHEQVFLIQEDAGRFYGPAILSRNEKAKVFGSARSHYGLKAKGGR